MYIKKFELDRSFEPVYLNELNDELSGKIENEDTCYLYFAVIGSDKKYFATMNKTSDWNVVDLAEIEEANETFNMITYRVTPNAIRLLNWQLRPFIPAA